MHDYPSDITREQYEIIREDLENAKRKTMPRKYDLYDIFCGILYVLKGGIQWRMLSADFPKWHTGAEMKKLLHHRKNCGILPEHYAWECGFSAGCLEIFRLAEDMMPPEE